MHLVLSLPISSHSVALNKATDVGLLRTVKKYGYKKNTANNKIGMGLVMSHTYNLSHAYLSHTPHFKAPYISGLIEGDRVARYR